MDVVLNPYSGGDDFVNASLSHVPFWKDKLMTPAFYKKHKWNKMLEQWNWRLGLAEIHKRQASEFTPSFDKKALKENNREVNSYIESIRVKQQQ